MYLLVKTNSNRWLYWCRKYNISLQNVVKKKKDVEENGYTQVKYKYLKMHLKYSTWGFGFSEIKHVVQNVIYFRIKYWEYMQ